MLLNSSPLYRNKTAFDEREPLKPSALLNALGTTDDYALIVAVSTLSSGDLNEHSLSIAKQASLSLRLNHSVIDFSPTSVITAFDPSQLKNASS